MAQVKYNVVTHGFTGKVGDLIIFRQRNGKTIVCKLPAATSRKSVRQLAVQEKFQQAVGYASSALNDPAVKALYEQNVRMGVSPYNLAIADFFKAPTIHELKMDGYDGAVGDRIGIAATDDTKVTEVSISIYAVDGTLIEEGTATLEDDQWFYTARMLNPTPTGSRIVAKAKDLPGNITTMEKVI